MSIPDKMTDYDTSTLDEGTQPTSSNLLKARNQLAAILATYPREAGELGPDEHTLPLLLPLLCKLAVTFAVTV